MTRTGGTMPRNTHRQPIVSVTRPARAGPRSPGTTQALETNAIIRGRADGAYPRAMAAYTTEPSAPDPKPWIARPAMTSGIEVATPDTRRPAANSRVPTASARPGPRRSASEPASVMPMTFVSQNALNAQP